MGLATYFIIGFIVIFMLWQLIPSIRARQMRGRPVPEINALLNSKQKASTRLLVYFWSQRCVMCNGMSKIIDELAESHDGILKVDIMHNMEITAEFGIMGTPSLVLVKDGKIEQMLVGAKTKPQILKILEGSSVKKQ